MTHDEIRRHELSDFLRTRRARISPAGVGFPACESAANSWFAARGSSTVGRDERDLVHVARTETSDQRVSRNVGQASSRVTA